MEQTEDAMTDAAYANAIAKRDLIAKQINDMEQELEGLRRDLRKLDGWLEFRDELAADDSAIQSNKIVEAPDSEKPKRPKNPPKEDVAESAREIIKERGAPMGRSELYNALCERGIHLHGKDPEMVLSTMLWRMKDRVVRLKSGGYWLADEPYRDADYYPTMQHEIEALEADIEEHDRNYLLLDQPTISDHDYDQLKERLAALKGRVD
ncbi:hypothetical protein CCR93_04665 [Rhodobium orientis]|nr:hypothetical protein [Rhodobium orientis]